MEYVFWLNGEFVPASQARVSIMDAGFMMGDVVFDTTRTFNGKVFRLRDHMERFYRSLHYAGIDPGMTMVEMEELTLEVARRNEPSREPGGDFCISQIVSSSDGVSDPPKPTVCNLGSILSLSTRTPPSSTREYISSFPRHGAHPQSNWTRR